MFDIKKITKEIITPFEHMISGFDGQMGEVNDSLQVTNNHLEEIRKQNDLIIKLLANIAGEPQ